MVGCRGCVLFCFPPSLSCRLPNELLNYLGKKIVRGYIHKKQIKKIYRYWKKTTLTCFSLSMRNILLGTKLITAGYSVPVFLFTNDPRKAKYSWMMNNSFNQSFNRVAGKIICFPGLRSATVIFWTGSNKGLSSRVWKSQFWLYEIIELVNWCIRIKYLRNWSKSQR